jgi:WhiB family transcriptional regulator, redox-sensing transcriptional regulator
VDGWRPEQAWWRQQSACRDKPTRLFFHSSSNTAMLTAARQVCCSCPVQEPCLAYALRHPDLTGVWAGTTPRQRAQLRAGRLKVQVLPASVTAEPVRVEPVTVKPSSLGQVRMTG